MGDIVTESRENEKDNTFVLAEKIDSDISQTHVEYESTIQKMLEAEDALFDDLEQRLQKMESQSRSIFQQIPWNLDFDLTAQCEPWLSQLSQKGDLKILWCFNSRMLTKFKLEEKLHLYWTPLCLRNNRQVFSLYLISIARTFQIKNKKWNKRSRYAPKERLVYQSVLQNLLVFFLNTSVNIKTVFFMKELSYMNMVMTVLSMQELNNLS